MIVDIDADWEDPRRRELPTRLANELGPEPSLLGHAQASHLELQAEEVGPGPPDTTKQRTRDSTDSTQPQDTSQAPEPAPHVPHSCKYPAWWTRTHIVPLEDWLGEKPGPTGTVASQQAGIVGDGVEAWRAALSDIAAYRIEGADTLFQFRSAFTGAGWYACDGSGWRCS